MPDYARYPRPLLWVGLAFMGIEMLLGETGWNLPDESLRGTAIFWWLRQLDGLIHLLFRCGCVALAVAVLLVIAAKVTTRSGAQD